MKIVILVVLIAKENLKKIPKQLGKESADDTSNWARGKPPYKGETPEEYAYRLIRERYDNKKLEKDEKGSGSEFSRIKKAWRGYK